MTQTTYAVVTDVGAIASTFANPTDAEIYADTECARRGRLTVQEITTRIEVRDLYRADPDEARAA
jgi:hypothetical protein